MANEITLLICGTQVGNTGIEELMVVGNTPLSKIDVAYPDKYNNITDYCIKIVHRRDYIEYVLLCNNSLVRSIGVSSNAGELRAGRLSFSMTLKRGFRFSDGMSPFDLLNKVKAEFMSVNMSLSTDGVYTFNPGNYDKTPFKAIVDSYNVEECSRYIEMSGNIDAYMVLPSENAISAFLRDTQYNEVASYKSVWVALQGNNIEQPLMLEIPRPKRYSVFVNGKKLQAFAENGMFSGIVKSIKETSEDYKLSFSVADLLRTQNPMFEVDQQLEEIRCTVKFQPKIYKRFVDFKFPEDFTELQKKAAISSFKLVCGSYESKSLQKDEQGCHYVQFVGEEIKKDWTPGNIMQYDYQCRFRYSLEKEGRISVSVLSVKVPEPPVIHPKDVTVAFKFITITGIKRKVSVEIELDGDTDESLTLIKELKPGQKKESEVKIELPSNRVALSITFKSKGFKDHKVTLNRNSSIVQVPNLKQITITDKIFDFIVRHHIIPLLIVFVIGFVLGVLAPDIYKSLVNPSSEAPNSEVHETTAGSESSRISTDPAPVNEGDVEQHAEPEDPQFAKDEIKIKEYIGQCEYATLPFADIREMNKYADKIKEKYVHADKKPDGYQKILDYAKYYTDAYGIIQSLINDKHGFNEEKDYNSKCTIINRPAYKHYRNELKSFRQGFNSIYFRDTSSSDYSISIKYYEYLLFENGEFLNDAKSFKDLEGLRGKWMKSPEYERYRIN